MSLIYVRADISQMKADAIVNAANSSLLGGGGADGAIHRAAGPDLLAECKTLGGCAVGQAKVTKGYRLPAKYVIHTVGPRWQGGACGEREALASCYRSSLEEAKKLGVSSVAFPLISSGAYGFPKEEAVKIAVSEIGRFLEKNEMRVYLVFFDHEATLIAEGLYGKLQSYIDDRRAEALETEDRARRNRAEAEIETFFDESVKAPERKKPKAPSKARAMSSEPLGASPGTKTLFAMKCDAAEETAQAVRASGKAPAATFSQGKGKTLEELLKEADEAFSPALLRLIDEKGMTDVQCYKKANIDRKLFSKIRSNPAYRPSKQTAVAFAVALELDESETQALLAKAGYTLSYAQKFDIIVRYFIEQKNYDVFAINEALFSFDQVLLGA